jgi:ribosomal protein S18 acetylase RimI-like enzyme
MRRAAALRASAGELPVAFVVPRASLLCSLGRDPAYRGEGLGPLLMIEGLRLLAGLGATTVRLEVAERNATAIALYERFGFRRASVSSAWRRELA